MNIITAERRRHLVVGETSEVDAAQVEELAHREFAARRPIGIHHSAGRFRALSRPGLIWAWMTSNKIFPLVTISLETRSRE